MASQPDTSPAHEKLGLCLYCKERERFQDDGNLFGPFMDEAAAILSDNARLFSAAHCLLRTVGSAVATYRDRLALLDEEREWRPDDEYEDMKGHYTALLNEATGALSLATAQPDVDPNVRFVC